MTIAKEILQAVAVLVKHEGKDIFTREEVRQQAGIEKELWKASYSPIFQGMREDQPGGAPNPGERYKKVFQQVSHGKHKLTDYGEQLLDEFSG